MLLSVALHVILVNVLSFFVRYCIFQDFSRLLDLNFVVSSRNPSALKSSTCKGLAVFSTPCFKPVYRFAIDKHWVVLYPIWKQSLCLELSQNWIMRVKKTIPGFSFKRSDHHEGRTVVPVKMISIRFPGKDTNGRQQVNLKSKLMA